MYEFFLGSMFLDVGRIRSIFAYLFLPVSHHDLGVENALKLADAFIVVNDVIGVRYTTYTTLLVAMSICLKLLFHVLKK